MAGRLGPVVEVGQRRVLRDEQQVDAAVVVEVADGQAAADPRDASRAAPAARETSVKSALAVAQQELGGHGVGDLRAGGR